MKFAKLPLLTVSLSIIAMLIVSACGTPASAAKVERPAIRIGVNKWVGWGALYIARDKGYFAKEGVKVDLTTYASFDEQNVDFASKKLDANATVFSDSIAQVAAQIPGKVIWVFDSSLGADVLVASSAIKSPADLKGKRVGLSYGTFGHVFALSGFAKYGIKHDDITIVNIAGESVPQALADGKIDAGHTWEPYLSTALSNGAHSVFTSADVPGIINDVLMVNTATLEDRSDEVKALLRAMLAASDFWSAYPDEGNEIVAKELGVTTAEIPAFRQNDHILSLAENKAAFDSTNPQSMYNSIKTISDFLVLENVITQAPNADDVLDISFVQAMSDNK